MSLKRKISREEFQAISQRNREWPIRPSLESPQQPVKTQPKSHSNRFLLLLSLLAIAVVTLTLLESLIYLDLKTANDLGIALIFSLILFKCLQQAYYWMQSLRVLRSAHKIQSQAIQARKDPGQQSALAWIEELGDSISQDKLDTLMSLRHSYQSSHDLMELVEQEWLRPLDQAAARILAQNALKTMLQIALVPWFLLQAPIFLRNLLQTFEALCLNYGFKPSPALLVRLLFLSTQALLLTRGTDLLLESSDDLLGSGVLMQISKRLGEGSLSGLLLIRLGLRTVDAIRPIPQTQKGELRKLALQLLQQDLETAQAEKPSST